LFCNLYFFFSLFIYFALILIQDTVREKEKHDHKFYTYDD